MFIFKKNLQETPEIQERYTIIQNITKMEKDNFLPQATVVVEKVFTALVLEMFKGKSKSIRTVIFTEDFSYFISNKMHLPKLRTTV